ncbi:ATP-binding protein [bacterium]|nr:ATP-binding protein [bacterium]
MIPRTLSNKLRQVVKQFPVAAVVGPRQSGKTTLVKNTFPDLTYVSLEDIDTRTFAMEDPRSFLATYNNGVILDEAQRVPELFSYLQTVVDDHGTAGQFILSGSQNFLLHEKVSQSLAGRVFMTKLLPLSLSELTTAGIELGDYEDSLFKGFYPAVLAKNILPTDWYPSYIQTYVERDVRLIRNITDYNAFHAFLKMCAGRVGQLLNLSSLANDCGITHNTAKSWLSVLEASFIVFLLQPHHRNFNKRLVKMPKLYFYDTGLACSLLGIQSHEQLITHHMKGRLFESMVIADLIKHRLKLGLEPNLFFWRDKVGHEIDCIVELVDRLLAIEIKAGKTVISDYFKDIRYWHNLSGSSSGDHYLVYGGDQAQARRQAGVLGWQNASKLLNKKT